MGHMREVKAALGVDDERLARINQRRRREPFFAELKPGVMPLWHVVTTHAAAEDIAAGHLSARRFGVYVPTFLDRRPGHRDIRRKLFPGYVLLFVWDIRAHWRRICSAPGVASILLDGDRPAVLPDEWVRAVQGYEIRRMSVDELGIQVAHRGRRFRPRKAKKQPAPVPVAADDPVDIQVSVSCYSALAPIEQLDEPARVGVLRQALGLPHTSL